MKIKNKFFTLPALLLIIGIEAEPFDSTYIAKPSATSLLKNANIYDGEGNEFLGYDLLIKNGKIEAIGSDLDTRTENAIEYDLSGMWVTPGIIDLHSHMGVYSAPGVKSSSDGNESTSPVTADVWAEHSVWTQDPQFSLALQGGVTTFHVLPGSANLIGGRGTTFKNVQSNTVQGMKYPDAPHSLKMACGENPKRVYGSRRQAPSTRMGNVAGYRKAWIKASKYKQNMNSYESKSAEAKEIVSPPTRDLEMDTLAGVLDGEILVQNHCYRAEEMAMMIDIAKEFGYKITAFHHAVEAYKIADLLADNDICGALWADWWGFKHEAYDMVQENIAIIDQARNGSGCAVVHSDDAIGIQHLNQEAAKALAAGNRAGFNISKARAMRWITSNPAKAAGIEETTGSLVKGKNADVVIWNKNPFSVYAIAQKVFIDGNLMFDRQDLSSKPVSDFDLGIIKPQANRTQ
ncbi:MAG: amidohydrolase [SAR86 cluster bacterium]|uniref:Amidohydrolase n=1 Tax=SAR86 cluster bacterium TaxID=2030880 RepID=A0A937M1P4_9GAMM|nr:amidohydrolase [SAR86 cluster bacterium]